MTAQKNVELHLHIEGAAPPAFIRALAAEKRQDLNGIFDARGAYDYKGFHDFLRVYEVATSVLTSPRDYARLLAEVLAQASAKLDIDLASVDAGSPDANNEVVGKAWFNLKAFPTASFDSVVGTFVLCEVAA